MRSISSMSLSRFNAFFVLPTSLISSISQPSISSSYLLLQDEYVEALFFLDDLLGSTMTEITSFELPTFLFCLFWMINGDTSTYCMALDEPGYSISLISMLMNNIDNSSYFFFVRCGVVFFLFFMLSNSARL